MKITCESCGANYAIADAKVLGKLVKVRCKSCGGTILVDGRNQPSPSQAPAVPAPASVKPQPGVVALPKSPASAPAAAAAPVLAMQAAPEAGVPEDPNAWSVNLSDTEQRTMTTEEVIAGYLSGKVTDDAFLWKDGMDDWVPVLEVAELRTAIEARKKHATPQPAPVVAAVPTPAPAAVVAAAPKVDPKPKSTARVASIAEHKDDLFGNLDTAGSELDVSVSEEEAAAARAAEHERMIGARNENSVLFSLDSLKAGVGAPTAAASKSKGPQRAAPRAPKAGALDYGTASAPVEDILGLGGGDMGGGQLFNPVANQALLTAPAPEPEPPKPKPMAVDAAMATPAAAEKRSAGRTVILGVGVAALVAIAMVGGMMLGRGKGEQPTAQNTPSAQVGTQAAAPTATPTAAPSPSPGAAAAPVDAGAASAAVDAGTAKPTDVIKPTDGTKPAAQADAGKPPAAQADAGAAKPAETAPPPGDAQPFSTGAAMAALGIAASSSTSCKKPDGPTGTGRVTVTFAPSGRVTNATVSGGAFGGTAVGGCVASVFRRAKVPPFSGNPVTVSKSFTINP